jgi:hypothetical protein
MSMRSAAAPAPDAGTTSASRLAAVLAAGVARVQGAMMETGPPIKRPNDEVLGDIDTQPGRSNAGGIDDGDGDLPFFDAPPVPPAAAGPSDDGKVEFADPPAEASGDGEPKSKKKGKGGEYAFTNAHQNFRASVMEWFVAKERLAVYEIVAYDPTYPVDDMLKRLTEQWEKTEYNVDDKKLQAQNKKAIALAKKYSSERSKFRKWDYSEAYIEFAKQDISREDAEQSAKKFRDQSGNTPIGRFDSNNKYVPGWTKGVPIVELHIKMITDVLETLQKLRYEADGESYATKVAKKIEEQRLFVQKRYDMDAVTHEFESKSDQKIEYGVKYYVDTFFGDGRKEQLEAAIFALYRKGFLNEDQLLGWDAEPTEDYKNHSRNRMLISMQAFGVLSDEQKSVLSSELVLAKRTVGKPYAGAVSAAEIKKMAAVEAAKKAEKVAKDKEQALESSSTLTEKEKEVEMHRIQLKLEAANAQREARLLEGDKKQEAIAALAEKSAAAKLAAEQARETARAEKAAEKQRKAEEKQAKVKAAQEARLAARDLVLVESNAIKNTNALKSLLNDDARLATAYVALVKDAESKGVAVVDFATFKAQKQAELHEAIDKQQRAAVVRSFKQAELALAEALAYEDRLTQLDVMEDDGVEKEIQKQTVAIREMYGTLAAADAMDVDVQPDASASAEFSERVELTANQRRDLEKGLANAKQLLGAAQSKTSGGDLWAKHKADAEDKVKEAKETFTAVKDSNPDLALQYEGRTKDKQATAEKRAKREAQRFYKQRLAAYTQARSAYEKASKRVERFDGFGKLTEKQLKDAIKKASDDKKSIEALDTTGEGRVDNLSRRIRKKHSEAEEMLEDLNAAVDEDANASADESDVEDRYKDQKKKLAQMLEDSYRAFEVARQTYKDVHDQEQTRLEEIKKNRAQAGQNKRDDNAERKQASADRVRAWQAARVEREALQALLDDPARLKQEAEAAGFSVEDYRKLKQRELWGLESRVKELTEPSKEDTAAAKTLYKESNSSLNAAQALEARTRKLASKSTEQLQAELLKLQPEPTKRPSKAAAAQIEAIKKLIELKAPDDGIEDPEELKDYLDSLTADVQEEQLEFNKYVASLPEYHNELLAASASKAFKDDKVRRDAVFKRSAAALAKQAARSDELAQLTLAMDADRESMAARLKAANEAGSKTPAIRTSKHTKWNQTKTPPRTNRRSENGDVSPAQVPFTDEQYRSMFADTVVIVQLEAQVRVGTVQDAAASPSPQEGTSPAAKKTKTMPTSATGVGLASSLEDLFQAAEDRVAQLATDAAAKRKAETAEVAEEGEAPVDAAASTRAEVSYRKARPLVPNRSVVREMLAEHVAELQKLHTRSVEGNASAIFANVGSALDTDVTASVDQLEDFFISMLTYKYTVLAAKIILLSRDYEIMKVQNDRKKRSDARLAFRALVDVDFPSERRVGGGRLSGSKTRSLHNMYITIPSEWYRRAELMIAGDEGRLPDQLVTPQPTFLPLRIAAPPRVGKSATALLVATLAQRLGMKLLYSVSPNKSQPIAELQEKLKTLRWGNVDKEYLLKEQGLTEASVGQLATDEAYKNVIYGFRAFKIDKPPGGRDVCRLDMKATLGPKKTSGGKALPRKLEFEDTYDMLMYSSDTPLADMERVAALLETYRLSKYVVMQLRDEAQSLAKDDSVSVPSLPSERDVVDVVGKEGTQATTKAVVCKSRHLAPPMLLNLRSTYSNLKCLNCLVTATHFGTLLEDGLFGYIGSISQNGRAGLDVTADVEQISARTGSKLLPRVVRALRPLSHASVSKGYIGVKDLVTWQGKTLELNTKSALVKGTGEFVVGAEAVTKAAAAADKKRQEEDKKAAAQAVDDQAEGKKNGSKRRNMKRITVPETTDAEVEQAIQVRVALNKGPKRATAAENETEEVRGKRKAASKAAAAVTMEASQALSIVKGGRGRKNAGDSDGEWDSESEDETEYDEKDATVDDGGVKGVAKPCSTPAEVLQCAHSDNVKIIDHFADWLETLPMRLEDMYSAEEVKGDKERNAEGNLFPEEDPFGFIEEKKLKKRFAGPSGDAYIYPMYIGALNRDIRGAGMASYMRRLAQQAMVTMNTGVEVAFMLYSSVVHKYSHLSDSKIRYVSPPGIAAEDVANTPIPAVDGLEASPNHKVLVAVCLKSKQAWTTVGRDKELTVETDPETGTIDAPVVFEVYMADSAGTAIRFINNRYKGNVQKMAFLGYDMFEAGLTVQTVITPSAEALEDHANQPLKNAEQGLVAAYTDEQGDFTLTKNAAKSRVLLARKNRTGERIAPRLKIYVATYMGLASGPDQGLDTSLQIVGRCFAELKRGGSAEGIMYTRQIKKPDALKIQLLAVDGMVDRLKQYSDLEEKLANPISKDAPLYKVLKDTFTSNFLQVQSDGRSLGTVGARQGSIAEVLGFTAATAAKFAKRVAKLRAEGNTDDKAVNAELTAINVERKANETATRPNSSLSSSASDAPDNSSDLFQPIETIPEVPDPSNSTADV